MLVIKFFVFESSYSQYDYQYLAFLDRNRQTSDLKMDKDIFKLIYSELIMSVQHRAGFEVDIFFEVGGRTQ